MISRITLPIRFILVKTGKTSYCYTKTKTVKVHKTHMYINTKYYYSNVNGVERQSNEGRWMRPGRTVELLVHSSVSHIFATRYSHFEDWKVSVIAFKIERQTHLTLWCKMDTTTDKHNRSFDCLFCQVFNGNGLCISSVSLVTYLKLYWRLWYDDKMA